MSHVEKIPSHSPLQVMSDLFYVQLFTLIVTEAALAANIS